jgi:hypothetical protein
MFKLNTPCRFKTIQCTKIDALVVVAVAAVGMLVVVVVMVVAVVAAMEV